MAAQQEQTPMQRLTEIHEAMKEARRSTALPSPAGVRYLRELHAEAVQLGAEIEARAAMGVSA